MTIAQDPNNSTKVVDRTGSINKIKTLPSLYTSLGLFEEIGTVADSITFDVRDNSFFVLDDHLRNTKDVNGLDERPYDVHTMPIGHFPVETTITRNQLANQRGFGENGLPSVAGAIASELEQHATTHEYHRDYMFNRALNGSVPYTKLPSVNLYTEFGVTKPTLSMDLGVSTTAVQAKVREATRMSKAGLTNGGHVRGFYGFCSVSFFEALVGHEKVEQAYLNFQGAPNPLRDYLGDVAEQYQVFKFGGVTWIAADDTYSKADGSTVDGIADDTALLVPNTRIGRAYFGPSKTLSGLGGVGQRVFARTYRDERDRFIIAESEANILPVVEQIGSIVELSIA